MCEYARLCLHQASLRCGAARGRLVSRPAVQCLVSRPAARRHLFHRTTGLTIVLSSVLLLAASCGDSSQPSGNADAAGGDANNPPNPLGLGPKPVDLGSPTDVGSSGSYVLLAKTGITNVTGSSITGGNLGLSPAAATLHHRLRADRRLDERVLDVGVRRRARQGLRERLRGADAIEPDHRDPRDADGVYGRCRTHES